MKLVKRSLAILLAFVLTAAFFPATAVANTAGIPISNIGEDLCVTADGKTFYAVQGSYSRNLIKFNDSGTVLETSAFTLGEYDHPRLALSPQGVLVYCNYRSDSLHFFNGGLGAEPTLVSYNTPEIECFTYDTTGKFIYLASKFAIIKVDAATNSIAGKIEIYDDAATHNPSDIAVDKAGNIYVIPQNSWTAAQSYSYILKREVSTGEWYKLYLDAGGITSAAYPHSIEVDQVGNVYAGFRNTGIFKFAPVSADGQTYTTSFMGNPGGYYEGITKDSSGNIYYASKLNLNNFGVYKIAYKRTMVSSVTLSETALSLDIGAQQQLTAAVAPYTAENKAVTWKSSNTSIATVNASGNVVAKAAGKATITATAAENGKVGSCTVTVKAAELSPISKAQLTYSLAAKTYSGKAQKVKVTPKTGVGKITAVYYNGSKTAPKNAGTYKITVDVAAGTKYKAAKKLSLGTFTIKKANLAKIKLTVADMSWIGKQLKPSKFTYNGVAFKASLNAKVKYGVNKNIGKGTVKLTGKGNFTGTKTFAFKILPKKTAITKAVVGAKQVKVTWKKLSAAQKVTKYQVRYRVKGTVAWKVKAVSTKSLPVGTVSTTIKGLSKGDPYQIQVRSYKKVGKTNYYSAWSAVKTTGRVR
jgi:hypothetical protein